MKTAVMLSISSPIAKTPDCSSKDASCEAGVVIQRISLTMKAISTEVVAIRPAVPVCEKTLEIKWLLLCTGAFLPVVME